VTSINTTHGTSSQLQENWAETGAYTVAIAGNRSTALDLHAEAVTAARPTRGLRAHRDYTTTTTMDQEIDTDVKPATSVVEVVLKHRPEDFLVDESIVVPPAPEKDAAVRLARLKKCGYTTFEAVSAVAEFFGISRADVGYAGLKDEDGITEQLISLPLGLDIASFDEFNARNSGAERFMRVLDSGPGREPMRIGRLDGNSFRLVVRRLAPEVANLLRTGPGKINLFFVNYYDTQRFGVPDGPKQTHLIGRALLDGDHATAFELLLRSGAAEAKAAAEFTGSPEDFFAELDPRTRSFYLCSHSSDLWNEALRATLRRVAVHAPHTVLRDGIPYVFATSGADVLALLRDRADLPYEKYRWVDGEMRRSTSARPTVVQVQLNIDRVEPDEFFPDHFACELSFFLPSGCYATTAVSQLFTLVTLDMPAAPDGSVQDTTANGAVDTHLDLTGRPAVWAADTKRLWRRCLDDAMRDGAYDHAPPWAGVSELRETLRIELGLAEAPLVTAGVRAAVLGLAALGRQVFVERPTYLGVPRTFERMGARVRTLPLRAALDAVNRPEDSLVWLTSPGRNPDGWSLDRDLVEELTRFVDAGGLVVQNETYRWFEPDAPHVPGALRLGSLSKLAGGWARVGWLAIPAEGQLPEPLAAYLRAATPPTHWQLTWARFAAAGGLAALRATVADAAAARAAAWSVLGGADAPAPSGASLLVRVPGAGASQEELARLGVRAGAGPDFGAEPDSARLCFLGRRPDDTLTRPLALLRDQLNATAVVPGSPSAGGTP
jgi:tRNA pseudouridine13 synthase